MWRTLAPGICEVFFLNLPLLLRVFRAFFGMLLVEVVVIGRVVGDSKQMMLNGVSNAGGVAAGAWSGPLCCARGGDDDMGGGMDYKRRWGLRASTGFNPSHMFLDSHLVKVSCAGVPGIE